MFDVFDRFGALNRAVSEEEIASLGDDARPKYLALVAAALDVEDGEQKLKDDTAKLYAAADVCGSHVRRWSP